MSIRLRVSLSGHTPSVCVCVKDRPIEGEWARESHTEQRQWRVEYSWGQLVKGHLVWIDLKTEMKTDRKIEFTHDYV